MDVVDEHDVNDRASQLGHQAMEDARRAHELYRYLQPENLLQPHLRRRSSTFDVYHDHVPSLSKALAPFCQLAAVRCNASKAMLNVMDRDVMYFLAEASLRGPKNGDEEVRDFVEDPILLSCSSVPLRGRICELTLRLDSEDESGHLQSFVVPDLSQSQFADLDVVAGPPFYRFYAGVPITTRDGVNIGSIAILDGTVRPNGLTKWEEEVLGRIAEQIMTYLETNRQAIEGRRSRKMAEGLEAFIAGKRSIDQEGHNTSHRQPVAKRALVAHNRAAESDEEEDDRSERERRPRERTSRLTHLTFGSIDSQESDDSSSAQSMDSGEDPPESVDGGNMGCHSKTFARAANLLRECLGNLGEEGSVHFASLATKLGRSAPKSHSVNGTAVSLPRVASLSDYKQTGDEEERHRTGTRSRLIASSTTTEPTPGDNDGWAHTLGLGDDTLREIMKRYPGGRLWTLDDMTAISSDDDFKPNGFNLSENKPRRRSRRKRSEVAALRTAFPHARQVLFTPVWDATVGSFVYACFVTTALETRTFNSTTELPFLNSFCSTVMAECSRMDTMMADKQKGDFVGTISHEMRSPLHGVLASVEFLAETEVTSFQKSLIETIDSCGRTLLDTINHVLDFSKVNSFQKQWQAANKKTGYGGRRSNYLGPDNSVKAASQGAPPLLQLFGAVDVSTVLEEVVDGLVLGKTYNSGIDITDTSREARGRAADKSGMTRPATKSEEVDIVLDIERGDWTFITQPGAVRRIIMNITGNAIKYTSHGRIEVRLQQKNPPEDSPDTRVLVFTVTDTGKGISPEFLASRLFVPFAQENALAPGTGLGMSIVRSIVLMLGGTIDVKSKVGKGTTVEVALPLKRPLPGQTSTPQNTPLSSVTAISSVSASDDAIHALQGQAVHETVAFYRPQPTSDDPLVKAIQHYIRDWYGLACVDQTLVESSSVVIVDEDDLDHLMNRAIGTPGRRPALVIMCSVSSRHSATLMASLEERLSSPVEFVAKPCGPNKLARSIRSALAKKRATKPLASQVDHMSVIPEVPNADSSSFPHTTVEFARSGLSKRDSNGPEDVGHVVQASETFAASQVSHNAQMAIRSSSSLRTPRTPLTDREAFPFPLQSLVTSKPKLGRATSRSISFVKGPEIQPSSGSTIPNSEKSLRHTTDVTLVKVDPHVLLVDDNKINLKLLETFLQKKRNYTRISKAGDGQQALDAVIAAKNPYDIIFMDISMPVMNGFEATRAIREYEERHDINPGAMVIALTGLANGRDQSEGFDSGCDIYMTKPVSFKEVGRLLDNWEGHQLASLNDATEQ